jgi:hypothetical protein
MLSDPAQRRKKQRQAVAFLLGLGALISIYAGGFAALMLVSVRAV